MRTAAVFLGACFSTFAMAAPPSSISPALPVAYFMATADAGKWVLTGNDLFSSDVDRLYTRLSEESKVKRVGFDVEKKDYPAFVQWFSYARLVTATGVVPFAIDKLHVEGGCASAKLTLTTNADAKEVQPGLVVMNGKIPKNAKLRLVPSNAAAKLDAAKVFAVATATLPADQKQDFTTHKVGPKDLHAFSGKFSKGATTLVWMNATRQDKRRESMSFTFAGLFDAKGALVETLVPAARGTQDSIDAVVPSYVVDLDGSGVESVVIARQYYEGVYSQIFESTATTVTKVVLQHEGC